MKTTTYPTKATIIRTIEAARASGLDVSACEIAPDGTIRIMETRAQTMELNDFDRWQDRL